MGMEEVQNASTHVYSKDNQHTYKKKYHFASLHIIMDADSQLAVAS
jgi:hypothetical protein